jgi:Tfp pilus assembly protein PilN
MFEIDLLKGKGRPQRANLKQLTFRVMLLLIPLGAAMVYAAGLQQDRIQLAAIQRAIAANETKLGQCSEDLQFLTDLRTQINALSLSIADIGKGLRYRLVVSAVLVELSELLPPEIFIREIDWKRIGLRERKADQDGGNARYESVVQRTLKLSLCGYEGADSDAAVQAYLADLGASPALSEQVREIRPAAREQRVINDKNATLYEIELYLKEQR